MRLFLFAIITLVAAEDKIVPLLDRYRVLLKDVKSLTFFEDRFTTGRRTQHVKQLFCLNCDNNNKLRYVECKNIGFNNMKVEWKCESPDTPTGYSLSNTEVTCEGYNSRNDKHILVGSCSLKYELIKDLEVKSKITDEINDDYQNEDKLVEEINCDTSFMQTLFLGSIMTIIFAILAQVFCGKYLTNIRIKTIDAIDHKKNKQALITPVITTKLDEEIKPKLVEEIKPVMALQTNVKSIVANLEFIDDVVELCVEEVDPPVPSFIEFVDTTEKN